MIDWIGNLYPKTGIILLIIFAVWSYRILVKNTGRLFDFILALVFIVYFVSFFANYPFEWFMILWFLRDAIIFTLFFIIWREVVRYRKTAFPIVFLVCIAIGYYTYKSGTTKFSSAKISKSHAELLVQIDNADQKKLILEKLSNYQLLITEAFPHIEHKFSTDLDNYWLIDIPDKYKEDIQKIYNQIEEIVGQDFIEFNEIYQTSPLAGLSEKEIDVKPYSNDPLLSKLWGFSFIQIEQLYELLSSAKIKKEKISRVFILDTGVDSKHEDISQNYKSLRYDYDEDKNGHGTHCAGIACAVTNNEVGIASFTPDNAWVKITSIKVLHDDGIGSQEGIIDGIILAADKGADVISLSLGGKAVDKSERAYNKAIEYANKRGTIVIVAAGNASGDATNYTPACCKGVITIAAITDSLDKAPFSNSVKNIEMKLAAPGVNIFSTFPNNQYKSLSGTSMATPYVAGLVALMKSINPKLTTNEVFNILNSTGISTLNTENTGKLFQAYDAIKALTLRDSNYLDKTENFFKKLFTFKTIKN